METFYTVQNIRNVVQSLQQCRDFVQNKQKKLEIDRLIKELVQQEESLMAKKSFVSFGIPPISSTPKIASTSTLQNFRVFADQHKGLSPGMIQQEAQSRGLDPREALESVRKMQSEEFRVQAEAIANHMIPEIRDMVYGQEFTDRSLFELVKRKVQGNLAISKDFIDPVTILIVQQLKLESGFL